MILGLGLDLAEISRMQRLHERFGPRFARRILHPLELEALPKAPAAFLASRFAAKEAAVKALGTGFTGEINFQSFCVRKTATGLPELLLYGAALRRFAEVGAKRCLLSLTHSRDNAVAVVIFE
ncbi:MAG: holo-ACP synthase [Deltaproteobacteria bacterium]|jgi:holo-[acyl-carrier protein] synthase|nr:holo-ACP synthase [Deltaproteobacteria bacterium]